MAKKNTDFLILFTGYSKRLIRGRKANIKDKVYRIFGFNIFITNISIIWDDAEIENPYALWFLERVSDKLNTLDELLTLREDEAKERFIDGLDINYRLFKTSNGSKYPLNLKSPYSWILARLIKRFDNHTLVLLKQESIGLLKNKECHLMIHEISKCIRAAINEPTFYSSFTITAYDIENDMAIYKKVANKMGVIPSYISSNQGKADFIPQTCRRLNKRSDYK